MRKLLLLSALCLGVSAAGSASTFNLVNNTYHSGATATGTVDIDTTTGFFTGINVTYVANGISYVFSGAPTAQGTFDNNTQYYEYSFDGGAGDILLIDVPGSSLIGYAGSSLCTLNNLCGSGYAGYFALNNGNGTATTDAMQTGSLALTTAATPEPSSLILLGSGLVGAVGVARRRFSRSKA